MDFFIDLIGLEHGMLRGFVFGIVHVSILIIETERWWQRSPSKSRPAYGAEMRDPFAII